MKYAGSVIEHFNVPPLAPAVVAEASAKFEETTAAFQAAQARYYALVTSRLDDIAEANRQAAAARIKGTKSPARTEAKIDADISRAKTEMEVLREATDVTGTALAEAVAEHRDEWLTRLDQVNRAATARLKAALAEVEAAGDDLSITKSAPEWLHTFKLDSARRGAQSQYPGTRQVSMAALESLKRIVTPEKRLVRYEDGKGVFEEVKS